MKQIVFFWMMTMLVCVPTAVSADSPYDFNLDGLIDRGDLVTIIYASLEDYDERYDVSPYIPDGFIDNKDISMVVYRLGCTSEDPHLNPCYYPSPYDVDGDGIVDVNDLYEMKPYYGIGENDPHWNSRYDVEKSGLIDIDDFMKIVDLWGCTVSEKWCYW